MSAKSAVSANAAVPRYLTVQCISPVGLHTMAYKEWGVPDNPHVLLCVHGVTRVADDFDAVAEALCGEYRVVCPYVVGRGRSGHLANPDLYQLPQYVSDMVTLLARLSAQTVDWFGASMGGLIGIGLASLAGNPIHKLILNDIGPTLNANALTRIGAYIGEGRRFPTFAAAEQYVKKVSLPFGQHTDAEWHKLAADVLMQDKGGQWTRNYDLSLAIPFKSITPEQAHQSELALWAGYDRITCPTLLVHGVESDLLTAPVVEQMLQRGPRPQLAEIANTGHAPTFVHADQIDLVRQFLQR